MFPQHLFNSLKREQIPLRTQVNLWARTCQNYYEENKYASFSLDFRPEFEVLWWNYNCAFCLGVYTDHYWNIVNHIGSVPMVNVRYFNVCLGCHINNKVKCKIYIIQSVMRHKDFHSTSKQGKWFRSKWCENFELFSILKTEHRSRAVADRTWGRGFNFLVWRYVVCERPLSTMVCCAASERRVAILPGQFSLSNDSTNLIKTNVNSVHLSLVSRYHLKVVECSRNYWCKKNLMNYSSDYYQFPQFSVFILFEASIDLRWEMKNIFRGLTQVKVRTFGKKQWAQRSKL